jgi:AhpD family alkylhydroperoxidase
MSARVQFNPKKFPDVYAAMSNVQAVVDKSGLEHSLLYLMKMRASQINGCGYCIDMHSKDARLEGETEQRLYLLDAWREAPIYSPRERAALAWTEAVTLLKGGHIPDEVYTQLREQFKEEEIVYLTLAVVAINGWNRIAVPLGAVPGSYQPGSLRKQAQTQPHA